MGVKLSKDPRVKQLYEAAARGDEAAVRELLAAGADANAIPPDEIDTPVFAAVYGKQPAVVRLLAEAKVDLNDGWPHTPLTVAARTKNLELIRALVEGGAKVNLANSSGETALLIAVMHNDAASAAELVRLGADVTLIPQKKKYDTATNYSPLQYAAMTGDRKLIAAVTPPKGSQAAKDLPGLLLSGAAGKGDLAEVKRLIEQEGVDINAKDARGQTPLISAAMAGKSKVVKYLLERGADVNLAGGAKSDDASPLIAAALSGKVPVVRMLVEAGADLAYGPADDPEGRALVQAKHERRSKVVEYLLAVEKERGGAGRKSATSSAASEFVGVTTFDTNDAALLVAADVESVAGAFAARIKGASRMAKALGKKVKLTGRCYAVFRINGQPWSVVARLACPTYAHWPSIADAKALSKSLETRALFVANSDTSGVTQYVLFDRGEVVEMFDYGTAPDRAGAKAVARQFAKIYGVDLSGFENFQVVDGKTFASSLRDVDVKKIKSDVEFVDGFVKEQNGYVPFYFEWGEAGESVELTLPSLGPDDVERLDYVAAK